jgi:hypothetical protein
LKLADVDLRFEGTCILVEEIADVGQFILTGLHLGLDGGDLEGAGIHEARDLVVVTSQLRKLLLEGGQFLG